MTAKADETGGFSLRRWSQRKLELARTERQDPAPVPAPAVAQAQATSPPGDALAAEIPGAAQTSAELPPIESLTIDSDFTPFFRPQVDDATKRAALKQLFRDPRFNVMDGLDTYIADYSLPDPIPEAMLDDLMQRRGFFALSSAATEPAAPDAGGRALNADLAPVGAAPAVPPVAMADPPSPEPIHAPMQSADASPIHPTLVSEGPSDAADPAAPPATRTRTGIGTDTGRDPP
jgi:Protein of unknown function (DUF3306)